MIARLILCCTISIGSWATCALGQTRPSGPEAASPERVTLVRDPVTGEPGYLLPRSAGLYLRQLHFEVVPALERRVASLEAELAARLELDRRLRAEAAQLERLRETGRAELRRYEALVPDLRGQLERFDRQLRAERRQKRLWRAASATLGASTGVLAAAVLLR